MVQDNNFDIIEEVVKQVKNKLVFLDLNDEEILSYVKSQLLVSNKKKFNTNDLVNQVLKYYYSLISNDVLEKGEFNSIYKCVDYLYSSDMEYISKLNMLSDYVYNIGINNAELFENILFKYKKSQFLIKNFLDSCDNYFYENIDNINTISMLENYCIINNISFIDNLESLSEDYGTNVSETFSSYLKQIGKIPLLSAEDERKLAIEYSKTRNLEVRNKLVESNLRLVVAVAKCFADRGVPILDLIEEGNIGLMRAVDKFKPELGYKLSTYAIWWIKQSISRAYYEQCRIIRIPVGKRLKVSNYISKKEELLGAYNGDISQKEIAHKLGISMDELLEYESLMTPIASMEAKVGEDEDSELVDFISDESVDIEETTMKNIVHDELVKVLDTLDYRMKMVLMLRYGLHDGKLRTLNETAEDMYNFGFTDSKLTRERIRQLEKRAFVLLKHPKRSKIIKTFYTPEVKKIKKK